MYLALVVSVLMVGSWVTWAAMFASARKLSFHQAFLHMPFRLLHRIDDGDLARGRSEPPVIYAVLHQSRLDPALMLSLLPSDTLHILDSASARSIWMEPGR
jgi:acyl-[acyl-carrier-protein]-phospholipid O-acyltransferase / long-chain-fatty-acid--[acyl-carrier-protein] ligase